MNDETKSTTNETDDELTVEALLRACGRLRSVTENNPFEAMMKRSGCRPEEGALMIIPSEWLAHQDLRLWLVWPLKKPWMQLSPHVNQLYILDARKAFEQITKPFMTK